LTPRGRPTKHGLSASKRAVRARGSRAIDDRTVLAKTLALWRDQLTADLGGRESLSTQEIAILERAVSTKLLVDSIDGWLLKQPSLVNARRRALLPVVRERTQLADALARYLVLLGLKRRTKSVLSLEDYLAARIAPESGAPGQEVLGREASSATEFR